MKSTNLHTPVISTLLFALIFTSVPFSAAHSESQSVSEEVNDLNRQISEKKQNIGQINRQISEYQKKIDQKQSERASLSVELDLIQNRIAKTQLEIEETNAQTAMVNQELQVIQHELTTLEDKLQHDKDLIVGLLQAMQVSDQSLPLQVFFSTTSFSDLFDHIDQLTTVNRNLSQAVTEVKASQVAAEEKQTSQLGKRGQLDALKESLRRELNSLDEANEAQEILITQTRQSEAQFQSLLKQLKQEQQYIDQQVSSLQSELEGKLSKNHPEGDGGDLSWPFKPQKGISTYFHDTTYPFRHLFEHSGLDLPAPTGTPVKVAADGYVAWARRGTTLYGNYIMVIHANGMATLYAHLSRIDVKADQFVSRGEVIGAVGSTGLSTGPHLHFEVRKNGIPTDPLNFLSK